MHRVASSELYSSGLIEIQTAWSFDDLLDANDVLDLNEQAQELATKDLGNTNGRR